MRDPITVEVVFPEDENDGGGVYISDALGEIVCWVDDEWKEDPEVPLVIAAALKEGYEQGGDAMRATTNHPVRWPKEKR